MPGAVSDDSPQPIDIDESLDPSKQSPKARNHPVQPLISDICSNAYDHGLQSSQLSAAVTLVRKPSHLDQGSITTLIKGLYPAERISPELVWGVVSSIGHGGEKPSPTTQGQLLRWLTLVREAMEDESALTKCYGALFNHLSTLATRQPLCHLLSLITKRRHVKPWRIQMLLELLRGATSPAPLLGLLRVYKEFNPGIPEEQFASARPMLFKHPDTEWRDQLRSIQERSASASLGIHPHGTSFKVHRNRAQRSRGLIPEVHTFHVEDNMVSLEEIDGPDEFADKFEKIELPSQMISALDDPLLQKYVYLRNDASHASRIDDWLALFFDAQLEAMKNGEHSVKDLGDVLSSLLGYVQYTKELPGPATNFFTNLVDIWDGKENLEVITELLSYLPLQSFDELYGNLLSRFEAAVLEDNATPSLCSALSLHTSLFRNWTSTLLSHPTPPPDALNDLSTHAFFLVLRLLVTDDPSPTALTPVLAHLSTVAHTMSLSSTHPFIRILTPSSQIIYLLTFLSPTSATLSPLCSVLATYKLAFEATMSLPPAQNASPSAPSTPSSPYPRPYVNEFNGFLMDICNLLWRSRAFNTSDQNALGCLVPAPVTRALQTYVENTLPSPLLLPSLFTLSFHPALSALSISVFREIEDRAIAAAENPDAMDVDAGAGAGAGVAGSGTGVPGEIRVRHAGPVHQRSLQALVADGGVRVTWAEYRMEVLQWLDRRGVGGVGELMFCTMKLLMGGKQARRGTPRTPATPGTQ
ncbi:MAG: hypothetical protein MMC23_007284 [Stictis urceolatum]|nr:hypothetical protein [Stictis urceolata]